MKLFDHYIIHVPNIWDEPSVGGVQMFNGLRYPDQERDRFERKCRKGVIVSEPAGLTHKPHNMIDPGWPNPRLHVGHDDIMARINEGMKEYLDWERFYNLAGCEEIQFDTLADYPTDARVGETVYFHPSVTEPENLIAPGLYKCRCDLLICTSDLRMQACHVLVDPVERQVPELGIIMEHETELLHGTLWGKPVLFREHSDWSFEIDGHVYYAMKEEDLLTLTPHVER